jgi:hypothetical protein
MNTLKIRAIFTKSHAQLRAARRDHLNERRHAILTSKGNEVIHAVAREMVELGLYAEPLRPAKTEKALHDYRFAIVRAIYRIDVEIWGRDAVGDWYFWLTRNGFDLNFGRNLKPERKRA